MVHYYGWYSSKLCGALKKQGVPEKILELCYSFYYSCIGLEEKFPIIHFIKVTFYVARSDPRG